MVRRPGGPVTSVGARVEAATRARSLFRAAGEGEMKAMVLEACGDMARTAAPLVLRDLPPPVPGPGELLVTVAVCGVCHTELDEIEGRTPPPRLPVIPGHQIVGSVAATGPGCDGFAVGDAVGVAWIFHACGRCEFCRSGRENLCPAFVATGRDVNGGYASASRRPTRPPCWASTTRATSGARSRSARWPT